MTKQEVRRRAEERGFSLADMTVAVGFMAVAAMTVLPNVGKLTARYRVNDAARRMEAVMQFARMKAIGERTNVVVQFTPGGWNIYSDADRDAIRDSIEGYLLLEPSVLPERTLYQYPALNGGGTNQAEASSLASVGCRCLSFQSNGLIRNTTGTLSRALALQNGSEFRQVTVSNAGAVTIQKWNVGGQRWE